MVKREKTITEEVIELDSLSIDACKKLKGNYTQDKRCIIRLETDDQNPLEAHLKKVNFKPAGQFLDAEAPQKE